MYVFTYVFTYDIEASTVRQSQNRISLKQQRFLKNDKIESF